MQKPFEIASKNIPSEQWNLFEYASEHHDGFDGFDRVWNGIAEAIGRCMVVFSELEVELDTSLYELISERTEQIGMVVTREMTYEAKCQVYVDILRMHAKNPEERQLVAALKKHLVRAGELRNLIAHAKWPSLTKEGFVFSRVGKLDAAETIPQLKYFSLNKESVESIFDYLVAVGNFPDQMRKIYYNSEFSS